MPFTENLDVFFGEFDSTVVSNSTTVKGIMEQPDELIADGVVLPTDYRLTAKTSDLGTLDSDSTLTVDGDAYTVRDVRKIDDGSLCVLSLTKD